MPLNRNELICLTAGIAVGAITGADVDKIKGTLAGLVGLLGEGVGETYAGMAQKVAEQVESLQDVVAEKKIEPKFETAA